jgi:hypothetical protein
MTENATSIVGFVPVSIPKTSIKFVEKEMLILLKIRGQKVPKPVFHYPFIKSEQKSALSHQFI